MRLPWVRVVGRACPLALALLPAACEGAAAVYPAWLCVVARSLAPGRSYKYYTGQPLIEFGSGMSYSTFTVACSGGLTR